ncbi:hypothetical protein H8959_003773 [Pygathrix nigripes]
MELPSPESEEVHEPRLGELLGNPEGQSLGSSPSQDRGCKQATLKKDNLYTNPRAISLLSGGGTPGPPSWALRPPVSWSLASHCLTSCHTVNAAATPTASSSLCSTWLPTSLAFDLVKGSPQLIDSESWFKTCLRPHVKGCFPQA